MTRPPPLGVALIGPGMAAEMHAAALAEAADARLAGVLGRDLGRARAFAERHGGAAVHPDLDSLLRDPAVDFVILATPPDARRDLVRRLASAGKPILADKPLERSWTAAQEIVALCEAAGTPLGVMLQHRLRPSARALADAVARGELGEIATVEIRVPWWREQGYYDAPGRGTYARDGGGVLITQAIHSIDLALQLCGPVEATAALTATSALHRLEAEDFAAAALRFRSGAVGSLMSSTTHFPGAAEEIVLNGTRGSAALASDRLAIRFHDGRSEEIGEATATGGGADPMAFSHAWHQAVIEDFAAALRDGRPPAITGRSALEAQALIDAITLSSREGRAVRLEEIHG